MTEPSAEVLAWRDRLKCDRLDPCAYDHTCDNHKLLAEVTRALNEKDAALSREHEDALEWAAKCGEADGEVTTLRVELAEARRERDEQAAKHADCCVDREERAALEADLAAKTAALARHGAHDPTCPRRDIFELDEPCSCGFDAALAASPGAAQVCTFCLGPLRNPHTLAGKPDSLLTVGAVFVCIPCAVKSRHEWAERAQKNEATAREVVAALGKAALGLHRAGVHPGEFEECVNDFCAEYGALLARPEVQAWAGR